MKSTKKIEIKWQGKLYEDDTWEGIYAQASADPWFGDMKMLKKRVKDYYGYSLGVTRTKKELFKKLSAIGEISIIKAEV